jgi:tRNA threonylcarbamoyladenosine biosynthesis protein TsaB
MTFLLIDTTNNKEVTVGLKMDGKYLIRKQQLDTRKAQVVLPMLEKLLHEQNLRLQDISAIEVNTGPGSFTGIRVGLSIANMLGFLLKVPINGEKAGKIAEATY